VILRRALSVLVLGETLLIAVGAFVLWRFGHSMARFDGGDAGAHVEFAPWLGAAGAAALLACAFILWRRGPVGRFGRLLLRLAAAVGMGLQALLMAVVLSR